MAKPRIKRTLPQNRNFGKEMLMEALGFVETKGYVPAFCVADAMVKAAEVTILRKVWVGAAYVTVIVTGEIGAVRTAVDAGAAVANQTESLYSCMTIPLPSEELIRVINNQ